MTPGHCLKKNALFPVAKEHGCCGGEGCHWGLLGWQSFAGLRGLGHFLLCTSHAHLPSQNPLQKSFKACVRSLLSDPAHLWPLLPYSSQGASFRSNFVSVFEKHLGSGGGGAVSWGEEVQAVTLCLLLRCFSFFSLRPQVMGTAWKGTIKKIEACACLIWVGFTPGQKRAEQGWRCRMAHRS